MLAHAADRPTTSDSSGITFRKASEIMQTLSFCWPIDRLRLVNPRILNPRILNPRILNPRIVIFAS